ncbi:MAG: His-Xaa-Ser system radical SAM maturase HxsB [Candidatus Aenigmarchaeota archaeon]|nr:His-Xaa-Ser system radical SAM maturase HxsB [Candidatus Aenigmarchaeota archaeon]
MVESFSGVDLSSRYIPNFYRTLRLDDKILVTTDHGDWVLLTDDEYRLLRSMKLRENAMLLGVLEEKGVVLTKNNVERIVKKYRERNSFLFNGPSLHILIPTFRCNQRCIYCHSVAKPENAEGYDMDEDTAKAVVDFIFKSPAKTLSIEFQGGDCSLNFDIVKFVIEYAEKKAEEKNKKLKFSVVTNLTKFDEDKLNFLKKHHIMGLATSLDGPKEVHNKNRKYLNGMGTYDDVVYWIKRIKEEFKNDFNLNAMTTITRYSLDYPEEIVDEFNRLGFDMVWFRFLNQLGFARAEWKKIGYTADEYMNFYNKGMDHLIKINKQGRSMIEIMTFIFLWKILSNRDPMFVDIQSPCGAGIGQLLYDNKGDIFTCDEAKIFEDFKLGNVKTSSYSDIFKNKTLRAMIDISSKYPTLCDACPLSPYCGICLVNIYKSQGSIIPKLSEDLRCKIFKQLIPNIFRRLLFTDNRDIFLEWLSKRRF